MTYANGDKYTGEWKSDYYHGEGTMTFADGGVYTGTWQNCQRHGKGTMTYAKGGKYTGDWSGNRHGEGVMTNADGSEYSGEWKDGHPHGQGTFKYADGRDVYVGGFKKGEFHGAGKTTSSNGRWISGTYSNGMKNGTFIDNIEDISLRQCEEMYRSHTLTVDYLRRKIKWYQTELVYKNGVQDDKIKVFWKNGKVSQEIIGNGGINFLSYIGNGLTARRLHTASGEKRSRADRLKRFLGNRASDAFQNLRGRG